MSPLETLLRLSTGHLLLLHVPPGLLVQADEDPDDGVAGPVQLCQEGQSKFQNIFVQLRHTDHLLNLSCGHHITS